MEDIILATPEHDGMPKGSGISDPTAAKAMKITESARIVNVIDEEREKIQEEMPDGQFDGTIRTRTIPETNLLIVEVTSAEPDTSFRALNLLVEKLRKK